MFERYTEKARRVIFFARYEASLFGSQAITAEHILLAIFREAPGLMRQLVPGATEDEARSQIGEHSPPGKSGSTSVDMPLNLPAKRALAYAVEEAERLGHEHIGCEHLLLALAREKDCLAAQILRDHGFDMARAKEEIARITPPEASGTSGGRMASLVHSVGWAAPFLWEKRRGEPQDALKSLVNQRLSLYHGETFDQSQFEIVKGGWVYYRCAICSQNLYAAENPVRSIGYTNGQDWLCTSCYERFAAPASEEDGDAE